MIKLKFYLQDLKERIGALYHNPVFTALQANVALGDADVMEQERTADESDFMVELRFEELGTLQIMFPLSKEWFQVKFSPCLSSIDRCDYLCEGFRLLKTNSPEAITAFIRALPTAAKDVCILPKEPAGFVFTLTGCPVCGVPFAFRSSGALSGTISKSPEGHTHNSNDSIALFKCRNNHVGTIAKYHPCPVAECNWKPSKQSGIHYYVCQWPSVDEKKFVEPDWAVYGTKADF